MKYVTITEQDILPLLQPQEYSEQKVMEAVKKIGTAIKSRCTAVCDSEITKDKMTYLCQRTGFNIKCTTEKYSFTEAPPCPKHVKQMVVLTARNDDIMRSLPYIEEFMPFITELTVCCPLRNVQPFREKYKGRLNLSFITDDELLRGSKLPSDHQARNFFLRCRLMEQESLDDVFIMTDDDYRPMKAIDENVFLSDGQYIGYYFYDITQWQGTYNDYTSFDKGAFATRDFLLENGYPVYQFSSHQPQIIDKRIFREMIHTHKGIENCPYDEWSTYFNYGLHHYPHRFKAHINVSMCWPGDTASWDLYEEPDEFLFENFYEELYSEGGIFEGFSTCFSENTLEENTKKAGIYRNLVKKQLHEKAVYSEYVKEYREEKGFEPSVVICLDKNGKLIVSTPKYIRLCSDCWTRVPVAVEKEVYEKYGDVEISYHFTGNLGAPVLNSPPIPVKHGDTLFMLPVRAPKGSVCTGFTVKALNAAGTSVLELI